MKLTALSVSVQTMLMVIHGFMLYFSFDIAYGHSMPTVNFGWFPGGKYDLVIESLVILLTRLAIL